MLHLSFKVYFNIIYSKKYCDKRNIYNLCIIHTHFLMNYLLFAQLKKY